MCQRVYSILIPLLFFLTVFSENIFATHLRAASFQVEQLNCNSLTFKITLTVYMNTRSTTPFGGNTPDDGHITFGDGTRIIIPTTLATPRPELGKEISVATFTVTHTYNSPGIYKINYFERDRSQGVLNISNPGDTPYSTSTTINTGVNCNRFPILAIAPVDRACSGVSFFHNAGASDPDGDSLSYELTVPARDADNPVGGYISPADPKFYVNHSKGNEAGTGPPSFSINPSTGLIVWNAPGIQGEYNIAFRIIEWRRNPVTEELVVLSTTIRDMQIVVEDCPNQRPDLTIPDNVCVQAGTILNFNILGRDPENHPVKIEAISEIFSLPPDKIPAEYSPSASDFRPSNPPAVLNFSWRTDCIHVRDQAYQVIFKITDQPVRGIPLVTFKAWTIKVIAPAPSLKQASLDLVNRSSIITWDSYACANAEKMQVWRKVDSFVYQGGLCDSGLPKSLGYQLVGEVNPQVGEFTDTNKGKGLAVGAKYCYRLVAAFTLPAGGKSYTSTEACVGPIRADAPVITHVTVEKTDTENGTVRVSWRSPFNIDKDQFPKPYHYKIYRAIGFAGDTSLTKAGDIIADTTFLDTNRNTESQVYNYRIVVYSKLAGSLDYIPVDTSAVASSVKLLVTPGLKKIELTWSADVPWSNVVQQSPYHYIYRSKEGIQEAFMELIDSVNVAEEDFFYTDRGTYKNQPIQDDQIYCYRIMTRGSYGNPAIALQKNFSQRVCSYPENNLLPCKPVVTMIPADCESFVQGKTCNELKLSNTFYWSPSREKGCRTDIKSYMVYGNAESTDDLTLLAPQLRDTFFTETGLNAFLRCYRVAAIDGLGHVSELSEVACNDNCPFYELPNVFTPNRDNKNDTFRAYSFSDGGEASYKCPRFVEHVKFTVYNRWGKKVYTYSSNDSNSILIDWNGRDDKGDDLESAIYYYVADVTFIMNDPDKRNQQFKGWIHLIR